MQMLRRAPWITRLVLAWFALFVGGAVASPLVRSEGLQMVCSGMGGMQLVSLDAGDDVLSTVPQATDCPLCMPAAAPSPAQGKPPHPGGLAYALHPLASSRLPSLIGLPWQARGPPPLSF